MKIVLVGKILLGVFLIWALLSGHLEIVETQILHHHQILNGWQLAWCSV